MKFQPDFTNTYLNTILLWKRNYLSQLENVSNETMIYLSQECEEFITQFIKNVNILPRATQSQIDDFLTKEYQEYLQTKESYYLSQLLTNQQQSEYKHDLQTIQTLIHAAGIEWHPKISHYINNDTPVYTELDALYNKRDQLKYLLEHNDKMLDILHQFYKNHLQVFSELEEDYEPQV